MQRSATLASLLFVGLWMACGTPHKDGPAVPDTPQLVDPLLVIQGMRCFRSVTTAGDGTYSDTMSISLDFDKEHVQGRMEWLPGMKDKMRGTLKGTYNNGRITAVYTYSAEGVEQREQRLFELGDISITVLSGEMVERDGIWVMKDPDHAVKGLVVPEVECP